MATTQVAEAEKKSAQTYDRKEQGGKLRMAGSCRDVSECGNMTTNTQWSGHGTQTYTEMEEDTMHTEKLFKIVTNHTHTNHQINICTYIIYSNTSIGSSSKTFLSLTHKYT